MESPWQNEQPPARTVAGALAHLARHMETGCPRAARLAAMLLDRVASDPEADAHLREHARELVDILERDAAHKPGPDCAPSRNASPSDGRSPGGEQATRNA